MQNEYDVAKKKLTEFENTLLAESDKIKGEQVSSTVINRKLVKLDADTAEQYRQARADVQLAANKYDNKLRTIQMMMQYQGQDYQNAKSNYEFEYNKGIKLYEILSSMQEKGKQEENRLRDDARANYMILQNMVKERPGLLNASDFMRVATEFEAQGELPVGLMS